MKRLLLWFLAIFIVTLICTAVGFHFWFQAFLQSEQCRQWIARTLSTSLHAQGELMPLQASAGSFYSDGFIARDGAAFQLLQADQLRAEVRFGYWAKTCSVEHLDIARLRAGLGNRRHAAEEQSSGRFVEPAPAPSGDQGGPWSGSRFVLRRLTIGDLELECGPSELKGARLTAWPAQPSEWLLNGQGGTVKFPDGSQEGQLWRVENFDARVHDQTIFLTGAQLHIGDCGEADFEGELPQIAGDPAHCHTGFSGIPVGPWLPEDWRARLTGKFSGHLDLQIGTGDSSGVQTIEGDLALADGELTALPVLDQIAAVTHADGFRRAKITKSSARVSYSADSWNAREFVFESRGLFRMEGRFTLKRGLIDGTFQLGMAPSTLQSVPGARERVFTVFRDGYLWTPVRVSGPADHPSEDLSERLAAAVIAQTAGAVQKSVRDDAQSVLEMVKPMLPVPVPVIPDLLK